MDGSAPWSDAVADRTVDESSVQASRPRWATDALQEHGRSDGVGRSDSTIDHRHETESRTVPETESSQAVVDAIDERAERAGQQALERAQRRLAGDCEPTAEQRQALEELTESLVASLVTDRVREYVAECQRSSGSTDDPSDPAAIDALARLFDLEPARRADSESTGSADLESINATGESRGNES